MRHGVLLFFLLTACGGSTSLSVPTTIATITPAWGPASGGVDVQLQGAGFTGIQTLTFAGSPRPFTVVDDTAITFTTPAAPAGLVTVRLTGGGGGVSASFAADPIAWDRIDGGTATAGLNLDVAAQASAPALAWHDDTLFVAWREIQGADRVIHVAARTGSTWAAASGTAGLNHDATRFARTPALAVAGDLLIAAWCERNAAGISQVRVAAHDATAGGTAWTMLDGDGDDGLNHDAANDAADVRLCVVGSRVYATWNEVDGYSIGLVRVALWNGDQAAPAWQFVDGDTPYGLNHNFAQSAVTPALLAHDGKLHAVWAEDSGSAMQVRVSRNDGTDAAPAWHFLDGDLVNGLNVDPTRIASAPRLASLGATLCAAWAEQDAAGETQVRVAAYDANAATWSIVDDGGGLNFDHARSGYRPQPIVVGQRLYVGWTEFDGSVKQVRVAALGGTLAAPSWSFVDGGAAAGIGLDPSRDADDFALALTDTSIHGVWIEANASGVYQVRVFRAR